MDIQFLDEGILRIKGARIVYRNFSGESTKYKQEGKRGFAVVIPNDEIAQTLINAGWPVKIKPPREEGEDPFRYLNVKFKLKNYAVGDKIVWSPKVYLKTNDSLNLLDDNGINMLDGSNIWIDHVDLDVRPYHWGDNDQISAWLNILVVHQKIDRSDELITDLY